MRATTPAAAPEPSPDPTPLRRAPTRPAHAAPPAPLALLSDLERDARYGTRPNLDALPHAEAFTRAVNTILTSGQWLTEGVLHARYRVSAELITDILARLRAAGHTEARTHAGQAQFRAVQTPEVTRARLTSLLIERGTSGVSPSAAAHLLGLGLLDAARLLRAAHERGEVVTRADRYCVPRASHHVRRSSLGTEVNAYALTLYAQLYPERA